MIQNCPDLCTISESPHFLVLDSIYFFHTMTITMTAPMKNSYDDY